MEKRQKRFYENISTSALKKDSFIYENALSYCQFLKILQLLQIVIQKNFLAIIFYLTPPCRIPLRSFIIPIEIIIQSTLRSINRITEITTQKKKRKKEELTENLHRNDRSLVIAR